ncbi:hypothetical protein C7I55_11565 [Sphingomonas deserti]|uniref:Peroxidase n=1 Tax=Allosphingosinicella deserti TaxID=2116704 RepID=A0A2P7QSG5_9SPHN|nr:hypothetical protein C7I55_11565 [Sphingomonas deserti]
MNSIPGSPPNWKLAPSLAIDTQGIVASGFGKLETGRALFLEFTWPASVPGGAWLEALQESVTITHGVPAAQQDRAAAIAFTGTGLGYMGLGEQALASFARPFREGMYQEDRMRRLGDRRKGAWQESVIDGGPVWSANTPPRDPAEGKLDWMLPYQVPHDGAPEEDIRTPLTVHALLMLYTRTEEDSRLWRDDVVALLARHHVDVVRQLELLLDVEHQGISREHLGFADGLSQPAPYGLTVPKDESGLVTLEGRPAARDPVQGVPLGEVLIGYQNGHSEPAPGPVVPTWVGGDPSKIDPRPEQAKLPPHSLAEGFADLGLNGSYLVVRELKQDVAKFWTSLEENAARIRAQDPTANHVNAEWIAERVIGRGRDGHLLCPAGYRKPDRYGLPDNGFLFRSDDPHGVGCPPGSHVRRANPRDALAPKDDQESRETLLQAANNHRILRRGRKFGPKIADPKVDDERDRGLLFMCLNTDIARQFEFVQQTWLLNPAFATLFGEVDPLLGPAGPMTIREKPLRRTVDVRTYVQLAGGDYFFLPSMAALRYLALL